MSTKDKFVDLSTEKVVSQNSNPNLSDDQNQELTINDIVIKYNKPWWRVPHLRYLNFCIFLVTVTSTNNGYDGSMLNGLQSLPFWEKKMGHPTGAVLGALSNGVVFGNIIAFLFASIICDKYGRKYSIMFGQSITVLGSILQGVSTNYAFFLCSRIVIGVGSSIATVGSPPLISELAYPTHRQITTAFYNTCWYLGAVVAAWVTYGTRNLNSDASWKIPSFLQGVLPLIQVLLFWMVPESPRFLINKGKIDEARQVLRKFHAGNDQSEEADRLIEFEIHEIEVAIEIEKIAKHSTKYTDFLKTKPNRKRLFLCLIVPCMMQLSGNGLVSYYLNLVLESIGITSTKKKLQINGCLMIYNMVISMFVASIVNMFKRRTLFLSSASLMLVTYVIWTILSAINQQRNFEQKALGNGVLAMIFFYYLAYDIGMNGLPYLYVTEALPYHLRAKGINLMNVMGQFVLLYNGFVNPIAMDAIQWKYYIVYCCIIAVEIFIIYFTFPETSGYSLEEVAQVFGDDPKDVNNIIPALRKEKPSMDHVERV